MQRVARLCAGLIPVATLVGVLVHPGERSEAEAPAVARGVVFHDLDADGRRDPGEPGLPAVRVSNGRSVVQTGSDGRYELPVDEDTIVFVIKPSGWRTPVDEHGIPRFYYNHKPQGSPKSRYAGVDPTGPLPETIDFALTPQQEPEEFRVLLFGDPQPRNLKELDYIAHDVLEELVGTDASFGITLGDILFDDLSMFDDQTRAVGLLGIPWYNVIGNHDINFDASNDRQSDETFERHFGPSYYSFDHGSAHFLVLDDVEWYREGDNKGYRGGFGDAQLEFVRNDLAMVPEDQLIVLLMHIPLENVGDRQQLYRLIEQRPATVSISGHTHHHEHRFIGEAGGWRGAEPHHHIINVTVSGSWWAGAPDERGIPHATCADGTPNGYTTLCVKGREYSLEYKAASRPADEQMRIHAPDVVGSSALAGTEVHVNVFNAGPRSRVEMRLGLGPWVTMKRASGPDPSFEDVVNAEKQVAGKKWRNLPNPKNCPHLWVASLPAGLSVGAHLIQIRADGVFGEQFDGRHVMRVTP